MKIRSKILLTTLLLSFFSIMAIAEDSSIFSVEVSGKSSFSFQLTNVKQVPTQVILKDSKGVTLHDETIMRESIINRKFNLKKLPSGSYTLLVKYGAIIKIQPIEKANKLLTIESEGLQTVSKPTFIQTAGYLNLNMLCLSDIAVHLMIQDSDGHVLYTEKISPNGSVQKRYNLLQLEEGVYTFTVELADSILSQVFKENIIISPIMASL